MKISSVMGRMTLRERKMLHESVKRRISEGSDSAPAAPPAEPSDTSPVGSTLSKDGNVIFKKTQEGWKTTLRISEDQILDLVNDSVQDEIKKQMRAARGQGDEIHIAKISLKDPGAANKQNELLLQRDGDVFADPVPVKIKSLESFTAGLDFLPGSEGESAALGETAVLVEPIGDAVIVVKMDNAKIEVPADRLSGFDDLFGTSNEGKILTAIQKSSGSKNPGFLKIPLSYALDGSIIKFMSHSVLKNLGIGKIKFDLSADGSKYVATVSGDMKKLGNELNKRTGHVQAKT